MNEAFKEFLALSKQDRQDVFEAEAEELDTLPTYVEKDFWVCLALDVFYNGLPSGHPRLLFKGGTSLSKAYKLIRRFSEDVDFTVFREDLGFGVDGDPASVSGKQRKKMAEELKQATCDYICKKLKDDLETVAATLSSDCEVLLDEEDSDRSTLLLHYPSLFTKDSEAYVQPRVKLEGGGRSALDPHESHTIEPFIASVLDDWNFAVPNVVTICPERTFWDKVMILHGWHCGHRDENRLPSDRQRLSRHYYDVAMIYKAERGKAAVKDEDLREDVRQHTIKFFNRAWMKLGEAVPGSIRLTPRDELLKALQADYQAMQGMMLGEVPDFKDILAELSTLEDQINEQARSVKFILRAMPSNNWVNATDLKLWAEKNDAKSRLPQLVRRLIHATVQPQHLCRIGLPAGESVHLGGYDGVVEVLERNAFIPKGFSVWEFSAGKPPKGKADENYEKRCNDPLGINVAETTFIFVTPRRFANKDEWVQNKNAEGIWAEVRAYDADDLEQWLEIAPAVHSWLARLIGKFPEGALSLGDFWDEWRYSTSPPMSTELHLAGRNEATEKIKTWLTGTPSSLTVQADSREEAIAFFSAVVHQLEEEEHEYYLSRCIIAQDELSWRHLIATQDSLILLPDFDNPSGIGNVISNCKHHIFIPTGRENTASNNALKLPRIEREGFENALINMGFSQERARSLIQESKRSLLIFKRQKATNPEIHCPEWAKPENATSLIPALLVGSWDDSKEEDRKVIEEIARKPYAEVSAILSRWIHESDPPVRRIGDIWQLTSRDDSWHLLSRFLLRDDLETFEKVVVSVLGAFDPRYDLPIDQRFMAAIYGKTLAHSHQLRQGLAETLALIASRGDKIQGTISPQDRANVIVHNLLTSENDWKLWASLSDLLPILAEAAPERFMDAVENALSGENPFLIEIFTDTDPMHGSPHTGLLWALDTFAWEPQYLSRVTLILGKLSRLDPGGRLVNRPIRSLKEIFLWWHPQTPANLEQRLRVIDTLLLRESDIAWNLICSLFPTRHSNTAFGTHKPRWRDWVGDYKPSVTYGEINQWSDAISERILSNVGISGDRWEKLLNLLQSLSPTFRDRAIKSLLDISQQANLPSSEKLKIWEVLRALIHKHRRYSSAAWVLPSELIDQLHMAYDNLEPPDSISRYTWLFSSRPQLPDGVSEDWKENEKALNNARIEAVEQIFGQGSLSELLQVATQVQEPWPFGFAIGQSQIASQVEYQLLDSTLGDNNQLLRDVAIGFVSGCFNINNWSWARNILAAETSQQWSALQIVIFFLGLPFSAETWEQLTNYGAEIETQYWKRVRGWWIGKEASEFIVKKFLEVNRPYRALNIASLCLNEAGSESSIPDSLIANVLEAILQHDSKETPAPDLTCFDYEVVQLFYALDKSKDFDKTRIAQLEWAYLPLLIHSERQPKLLHQELSQNPLFFVEVLTYLYRSDKEEDNILEPSVEDQTRARLALELLESWEQVPGLSEDRKIIPEQIKTWVEQARKACHENNRGDIGDHVIGEILAYAPADDNGIWPDIAIRELIEEIASKDLENGVGIGIHNKRGVHSRSLGEGGKQERELAETYQRYAMAITDEYPRTASLLRRIAHSYTSDAHREDVRAELRDS